MRRVFTFFAMFILGSGPLMALHSPEPGVVDKDLRAPVFSQVSAPSEALPMLVMDLTQETAPRE